MQSGEGRYNLILQGVFLGKKNNVFFSYESSSSDSSKETFPNIKKLLNATRKLGRHTVSK